jgi:hypothetical protein
MFSQCETTWCQFSLFRDVLFEVTPEQENKMIRVVTEKCEQLYGKTLFWRRYGCRLGINIVLDCL